MTLILIYSALIVLASLLGGWLPMWFRLTHRRLELAVSFVAGAMLGVALLHLLPHAVLAHVETAGVGLDHAAHHGHDHAAHDSTAQPIAHAHHLIMPVMYWLIGGFLLMFFIERFFCFHHHEAPAADGEHHACGHEHHKPGAVRQGGHRMRWSGAAIGLTVHSIVAGIALAAAVAAESTSGHAARLAGFSTFLVILLHKPFDSLTLGALMSFGDEHPKLRHLVNGAFALAVPLGAVVFAMGLMGTESDHTWLLSAGLAFAAGSFLCIALSDLLPELQFHRHDRVKLTLALMAGLALAWAVGMLE